MTVLRPVVQAAVLPMFGTRHDLSPGRAIAGQLVRDHHARRCTLLLEQFLHQAFGCFGVAAALDQNVKYGSMLIDSSPEPALLPEMLITTSSRCHLPPGAGRHLRIWLAKL